MKTTPHNPARNTASGHTPGPWAVAKSKSGAPFITNSTGKFTVANSFSNAEDAAFAVLACNNHAALVEALEYAESVLNMTLANDRDYNGQPLSSQQADAADQARAALARAKGGEVS
jgi:hypothetical protein